MNRTTLAAVLLAGQVTAALIVTGVVVSQGARAPAPPQVPASTSSDRS